MKILQTTDLKKYYGTEPNITRALDGVNFSVEEGEFVAVVGTSGSGKSTLLHMMGGLDTPTSGSVMVRDKELAKMNDEQLTIFRRRNIGFIFQNYNLVPIKAWPFCRWPGRLTVRVAQGSGSPLSHVTICMARFPFR